MKKVAILTEDQKNQLMGRRGTDSRFNPKTDGNGKYFISKEEIDQCDLKEFEFLKGLKQTKYKPVPFTN